MAYGTPATLDDVEAYYTHIRGGRTVPPALVDDLRRRYKAIGGTSPLLEITRAQAAGVQRALGDTFRVELGMKHAPPFIEDAVAALARDSVRQVVAAVLAPHYSELSVGQYLARGEVAARGAGIDVAGVERWHLVPGYLDLLATGLTTQLDGAGDLAHTHVLFTAHSLPARILETGDPYPDELRESAEAIATRAGLADGRWSLAWQSAGRTPEPWLGPSVLDVLPELAAQGVSRVIVCPQGFVSDHLEVLYDLDIQAKALADDLGIAFSRTASPNDDPALCQTLAGVIRDHVGAFA